MSDTTPAWGNAYSLPPWEPHLIRDKPTGRDAEYEPPESRPYPISDYLAPNHPGYPNRAPMPTPTQPAPIDYLNTPFRLMDPQSKMIAYMLMQSIPQPEPPRRPRWPRYLLGAILGQAAGATIIGTLTDDHGKTLWGLGVLAGWTAARMLINIANRD